jgi:membrane protein required for colicin V production
MAGSLLALVAGIWGAIRFSDLTTGFLAGRLNMQSHYLPLLSFALTFVVILIAVHLFAGLLDRLARAAALGLLNRLAGLVFSLIKTSFLISIILVILNTVDKRVPFIPEEHKQGSFFYQPLSKLAPAVFPYLNFEQLQERIRIEGQKEYTL